MTYNNAHFDPELNARMNDKIASLELWQKHVLEFLIDYLLAGNGQEQLKHCGVFLELLAKTRFNLEAANLLLPKMQEDYRFKTSINLIYRAIIDDIISSYHLFNVIVVGDPEQQALKNELRILHREHIMSMTKGVNADREFEKLVDSLKEVNSTPDIDVELAYKTANPDLVTADGKWKKNKEIRTFARPEFEAFFNETANSQFISESQKIGFIKSRGVTTHHNIEAIFKYLSQFQHFTPKAHDMLLNHIEFDIEIYQRCLGELVMLLDQLLAFLVLEDKAEIKKHWDALAPNVFNSFA